MRRERAKAPPDLARADAAPRRAYTTPQRARFPYRGLGLLLAGGFSALAWALVFWGASALLEWF